MSIIVNILFCYKFAVDSHFSSFISPSIAMASISTRAPCVLKQILQISLFIMYPYIYIVHNYIFTTIQYYMLLYTKAQYYINNLKYTTKTAHHPSSKLLINMTSQLTLYLIISVVTITSKLLPVFQADFKYQYLIINILIKYTSCIKK